MTHRTRTLTSGVVDALIVALALLIVWALLTPRVTGAEVVQPGPDPALGCYTYARNVAAYEANKQEWAPLTAGEIIVAASLAGVPAKDVDRGFIVLTGFFKKPWAVGLEIAGCLIPKPLWLDSPEAVKAKAGA
jgi:hypothetical protein